MVAARRLGAPVPPLRRRGAGQPGHQWAVARPQDPLGRPGPPPGVVPGHRPRRRRPVRPADLPRGPRRHRVRPPHRRRPRPRRRQPAGGRLPRRPGVVAEHPAPVGGARWRRAGPGGARDTGHGRAGGRRLDPARAVPRDGRRREDRDLRAAVAPARVRPGPPLPGDRPHLSRPADPPRRPVVRRPAPRGAGGTGGAGVRRRRGGRSGDGRAQQGVPRPVLRRPRRRRLAGRPHRRDPRARAPPPVAGHRPGRDHRALRGWVRHRPRHARAPRVLLGRRRRGGQPRHRRLRADVGRVVPRRRARRRGEERRCRTRRWPRTCRASCC